MTRTYTDGIEDAVTLAECPPGPFLFNGSLGFKTEYGAMRTVGSTNVPGSEIRWAVSNYPDAYCMDSGEYFWGGTTTHEARAKLMVQPIRTLSTSPSGIEDAREALTKAAEAFRSQEAQAAQLTGHIGEPVDALRYRKLAELCEAAAAAIGGGNG